MLTNGVMGALALGIFWVNVLLIAAATVQELRALLARRAGLGDIVRGKVTRGDGPDGGFAIHRIEQVGRAAADGSSILFHDKRAWGEVCGGALATARGESLDVAPAAEAEVWLDAERLAGAGACASNDQLDQAYASARKAHGFARTVEAAIRVGAEVFFAPSAAPGALVATMDPRALLARKAAVAAGFVVAELAAAASCTALALRPPVFEGVSTAGGVLCLGFFFLVQPAGTRVRDALAVPSHAVVRARWARSG